MKVVSYSLEQLFHDGRVQGDEQYGRVYTWKKGDNLISFISFKHGKGVRFNIQIRNITLHPQGKMFERLYNEAEQPIPKFK